MSEPRTIDDDVKDIEKIIYDLMSEYLEIEEALKSIPDILKDKIKLISDTSFNVFVIASNRYPNKDLDDLNFKAKKILWLTKEYTEALESSSVDFEVLLKESEISSKLYKDLITSDYRLITDQDKVKSVLIKALGSNII